MMEGEGKDGEREEFCHGESEGERCSLMERRGRGSRTEGEDLLWRERKAFTMEGGRGFQREGGKKTGVP